MNKNFEGVVPEAPERPRDEMDSDALSSPVETFADDDAEIATSPKGVQATEDLKSGKISRDEYDHIVKELRKDYNR